MNEAIREVIELTRGEAAKNGASVQMGTREGFAGHRRRSRPIATGHPQSHRQRLSRRWARPRKGREDLFIATARAEANGVLVSVKDSGPGVAPENLAQLFTPFYTTKPGGLGVGLSICRSIIEAHGGRLWVTANLPRGAIFQFTMPSHAGRSP